MNVSQTLEALKRGDTSVYEQLYADYREGFYAFAKAYTSKDEIIIEAYQEAVITLYENVKKGKVTSLSSSLKTYVYAIGKYKLFEQLRKEKKLVPIAEAEVPVEIHLEEEMLTERQRKLKSKFASLGSRCQHILELFYLNGFSIREIKETEGYENENTVKAQKSRCLRQLKTLINA